MAQELDCRIEMRHLRLISALTDHGTMTAAAAAMGLTQPALSHQLREIETHLRAPLFVRTARRMVLTSTGEQLAAIARSVLPQIDGFQRQVVDGGVTAPRGRIRIATECYTAYHWLPGLLRSFRDRWPHVELRVEAEHTSAPITALREGALDLAVVFRPVEDKGVRLERLFQDEVVLITARDHPLARKEYISLDALADEHLYAYAGVSRRSFVLADLLEPAGVRPREVTRLQLTEAIVELVAAGLGVAILAKWAVQPAVQARSVSMVRIGRRGVSRTWYAATRSRDAAPAFQFDLIDLLKRQLLVGPVPNRANAV